jgi:hypothetical protein
MPALLWAAMALYRVVDQPPPPLQQQTTLIVTGFSICLLVWVLSHSFSVLSHFVYNQEYDVGQLRQVLGSRSTRLCCATLWSSVSLVLALLKDNA